MDSIIESLTQVQDESLLLVRIVLSVLFVAAARNKSKDIKSFAQDNGLPVPIAFMVMVVEFSAGVGLLFGFFPRLASLAVMGLMIGSMSMHILKWKSPYWASEGGWEYDLMIFIMASVIATSGAGVYTLYAPF